MSLFFGEALEQLPLLAADSFDMVFGDMPFGTTNCKWDSCIPLEPLWKELDRVTKPT